MTFVFTVRNISHCNNLTNINIKITKVNIHYKQSELYSTHLFHLYKKSYKKAYSR